MNPTYLTIGIFGAYALISALIYLLPSKETVRKMDYETFGIWSFFPPHIVFCFIWPICIVVALIALPFVGLHRLRQARERRDEHRQRRIEEPKSAPYGCVPEKKSVKR